MIKEILNWLLSFFRKPTGVLPIKVMGSDEIYVPSIQMDGNWLPYMTKPYETQYLGFDQLNCVTKSGMHCVEAILNYYLKNGGLPKELEDFLKNPKAGYLNDQGFVDLSERFTAKMAGTTKEGLGMDKFWQSINKDGFVPKKVYPDPTGSFTWEDYYKPIPENVIEVGRRSAKIFNWIWKVKVYNNWNAPNLSDIRGYLKGSPIHFSTCLCNRDFAGVLRYTCGSKVYQHAMTLYSVNDFQDVLDQYDPFLRKSDLKYPLPCVIVAGLLLI